MTPPAPAEDATDGSTRLYVIWARVVMSEAGDNDTQAEAVYLKKIGVQKAANHDAALRTWGTANLASAKLYKHGFVVGTDSAIKELGGGPEERFVVRELVRAEAP